MSKVHFSLLGDLKFPASMWVHALEGQFTDCIINARQKSVRAHRNVLSSASDVLHVEIKLLELHVWLYC